VVVLSTGGSPASPALAVEGTIGQVRDQHASLAPGAVTGDRARVTGRLSRLRRHGGISFGQLEDGTGTIQLVADREVLGAGRHRDFNGLGPGDPVSVEGPVVTTRRGELSVRVDDFSEPAIDPGPPPETAAAGTPVERPGLPSRSQPDAAGPAPEGPPPPELCGPPGGAVVRLIAALTALGGVVELLSSLPFVHRHPSLPPPQLGSLWFPVAGHVVSVIVGLLLLLLAGQLGKRKRVAWRVAVACFALGAGASMLKGSHLVAAAFCLAMLGALVLARRRFEAPGDPPSLLRLVRFVPLYLLAVLAFGFAGLVRERDRIEPGLTVGGGLETVFSGLIGADGVYTYRSPLFAHVFPAALLALGIAGLAVFLLLLFRPLTARPVHGAEDWEHARRLVRAHGWDTLAYFALRRDKSFFFSTDGEAMLAYTYLNGYALVSGDPIGAPGSVARVVDEFLAMCARRAWNPAFLAIRERDLGFYAARGFSGCYLGDEAVLRCDTFHTRGPGRRSLRAAVNRAGRRYRFQLLRETEASPHFVEQLNAMSARWRGDAPERGFTMSLGQAVAGADPDFLLAVAIDGDGKPGGFLRIVPAAGPEPGYTLDLMRHDPSAPNGTTEFLLVSTATALAERGVVRLSMNFAVWGRLFVDTPATLGGRLARCAVRVLNPFFQIKSLRDFNAKFEPDWVPRALAYRGRADLPRIGVLYAGAERLLRIPGLGRLLVPRAPTPSSPAPAACSPPGSRPPRPWSGRRRTP
jgi:lysyl-tRNA synthetase, class II